MACEPIPTRTMNTQWQVGSITDEPAIKSQKIAAICLPTSDILQPMRGNQQSIKRTGSIREENDDPLSFHWRLHRHQIESTQPQKSRGQSTGCLCLIFPGKLSEHEVDHLRFFLDWQPFLSQSHSTGWSRLQRSPSAAVGIFPRIILT